MNFKPHCTQVFLLAEWIYYATNFVGVAKQRSVKYYSWKEQIHKNQFNMSALSLTVPLTPTSLYIYIYIYVYVYIYAHISPEVLSV